MVRRSPVLLRALRYSLLGDLQVIAFDIARIDLPCERVHDRFWRSPFALVDRPPSKETTAAPNPERLVDGRIRHRMGERRLKAALMSARLDTGRRNER